MSDAPVRERKRRASFAFLFAIPTMFACALLCIHIVSKLLARGQANPLALLLFLGAFFFSCFNMRFFDGTRFRTLIHEMKHAALLILTGNHVSDLQISEDRGHVKYRLDRDRVHFEPFVILAPYFLPFFSVPFFLLALIFGHHAPAITAAILGAVLGIDLQMGLGEVHPHQEDLKRIWGGRIVTRSFLTAAHASWFCLFLLWAAGGNSAYVEAVNWLVSGLTPYLDTKHLPRK